MATKREIDKLFADIPQQVAAGHQIREHVETPHTKPDVGGAGYDADVVICPSDYGFDMWGATGAEYVHERSKEIARASLKVHGISGSGTDHSTKGDFGAAVKNARDEVETFGPAKAKGTGESHGSTQEED
jgi:hypothetical protein